jgi:hypothetical protein
MGGIAALAAEKWPDDSRLDKVRCQSFDFNF